MKKIFFNLLLILFFSLNVFSQNSNQKENINFLGSVNAPNTLIEYASMSCIHCANFHNQRLPDIKKELIDTGELKYIYKDFPLDMPAMLASMVAHCFKGEQYYEVLNSLFRNQKKWVMASENKKKLYNTFADTLKIHGVSLEKVNSCTVDSEENKKKWDNIIASRLEGQKAGVNSTPTFILNGNKLEGLVDLEKIKKHIY